jgi:uncharacterized protein YjiS (DUF1127 family)
MTTLTFSHLPSGHGVLDKITKLASFAWIAPLWARIRYEMELRTAIEELHRLDDRCLKDIGIDRNDIECMVRNNRRF